jgi:hypothetical protein
MSFTIIKCIFANSKAILLIVIVPSIVTDSHMHVSATVPD